MNKPISKKGKLLFINAKELVTRKNSESYLEQSHINEIIKLYNDYNNGEHSSVVSIETIRNNNYKLNVGFYAKSNKFEGYIGFNETIISLQESSKQLHKEIDSLMILMNNSNESKI